MKHGNPISGLRVLLNSDNANIRLNNNLNNINSEPNQHGNNRINNLSMSNLREENIQGQQTQNNKEINNQKIKNQVNSNEKSIKINIKKSVKDKGMDLCE